MGFIIDDRKRERAAWEKAAERDRENRVRESEFLKGVVGDKRERGVVSLKSRVLKRRRLKVPCTKRL